VSLATLDDETYISNITTLAHPSTIQTVVLLSLRNYGKVYHAHIRGPTPRPDNCGWRWSACEPKIFSREAYQHHCHY